MNKEFKFNTPNNVFNIFSSYPLDDIIKKYHLDNYYELKQIHSDIVINTNHEVIDNNADEVVDGKYVWHIKKDVNDYELKFITSKKSVVVKKKIDIKLLMYIGFSSAVFLLLLILGIIIKHKRVNKI